MTEMYNGECGPLLPGELFWEILSWLPVKALMQLRCVCKSWNSIIFDPIFVKLHLQRSSKKSSILYALFHYELQQLSLHCSSIAGFLKNPLSADHDVDFSLNYEYGEIIGVCNGLVCLRTETHTGELTQVCIWVQFWNPVTRLRSEKSCICSHENNSDFIYVIMGFGYDVSRDTYKVVAVIVNEESLETEVRVHCLGDSCSKKVLSWSGFPKLAFDKHGQYLSGTLNWLTELGTSIITGHSEYGIYSYDLRYERHKCLLLPNTDLRYTTLSTCNLGVLWGCLCFSKYIINTCLSIWQMKEFGVAESWTMLLNVSLDHHGPSIILYWQFLLSVSEAYGDFKVVICTQRDNTLDLIHNHPTITVLNFFHYVQSLVLPY